MYRQQQQYLQPNINILKDVFDFANDRFLGLFIWFTNCDLFYNGANSPVRLKKKNIKFVDSSMPSWTLGFTVELLRFHFVFPLWKSIYMQRTHTDPMI